MLTSILSYEDRGSWGDSRYRGNCSGFVIRDLLNHFRPKKMLEVFAGSGTGFEVARELGYTNSIHLDLNPKFGGWNALQDEIPEGSDFVFTHPPYHNIIQYSGAMWGVPHPDDLSRCNSYDDFINKLNIVHSKIYASLRNGGRMAILVGDVRKKGEYFSIQRDMQWIGKCEAHLIKTQHNHTSGRYSYKGKFIPIEHEHLLIFRKNDVWFVPVAVTVNKICDLRKTQNITWRDIVQAALEQLGGVSELKAIYEIVKGTEKAKSNNHVEAKVRQVLQKYKDFEHVRTGVWSLKAS